MPERILVVDKNLDSLKLVGLMLQRQGYQVSAAPDGIQALGLVETERPDLILMDIMVPDMDGYELCRRLKSDPRLAKIPLIIFTAKSGADDKVAGFEAGADDYLTKPTHPSELASRIKAMLARSRAERSTTHTDSAGAVVASLGVRGGAGTTTLAINLSAVVAEGETNIILADLQHGAGMVSYALRLSEGTGLAHLLDLQVDELSKEEVENQLVILSPGLRLLLADYRPGESLTPAVAPHVERIIGILSQLARLVVLDMGNKPGHTVFNSLRHVDRVLMCIAPERTSIRLAQNLLSQAERSGIGRNRFSCVLMNTAPLIPASYFRATESQLGLEVLGNVTSVPELARMAGDQAKPMVAVRPDSPTATEFRQLGERVLAKLDRLRG